MQDMLLAIWHQDFEQLIQLQAVGLLVTCLVVILFLESSFVFLPLPGDSLVLLAGGLVGMGVLGPEVVFLYLPLAAGVGSAILPASTFHEGDRPGVRRIPLINPVVKRKVILTQRKNNTLSPAA